MSAFTLQLASPSVSNCQRECQFLVGVIYVKRKRALFALAKLNSNFSEQIWLAPLDIKQRETCKRILQEPRYIEITRKSLAEFGA